MDRSGKGRCAVPCLKGTYNGGGYGLRKKRKEKKREKKRRKSR
jgi:hypothetical protein